jgi:hypothetical protein
MLKSLIAAALLASSTALFAQAAPAPAEKTDGKAPRHARHDCSKAQDPKACEEKRAKAREAFKKARAACEAKAADERRACVRAEMRKQRTEPNRK